MEHRFPLALEFLRALTRNIEPKPTASVAQSLHFDNRDGTVPGFEQWVILVKLRDHSEQVAQRVRLVLQIGGRYADTLCECAKGAIDIYLRSTFEQSGTSTETESVARLSEGPCVREHHPTCQVQHRVIKK